MTHTNFLEKPSLNLLKIFHTQLSQWFKYEGRHTLPWKPAIQRDVETNLYYVWLSEIMLQQTQVITVIPYFDRFVTKFPSIETLAIAPLDDVLKLWEGLGYYSRAKNLHRAAQIIYHEHGGHLPKSLQELMHLPGVGRTTAAAILAQGYYRPFAIFDGNVKRVLARILGCQAEFKQLEKYLLPYAIILSQQQSPEHYTQAIMDFGATLCRKKPDCMQCFFNHQCVTYKHNYVGQIPTVAPRKIIPKIERFALILQNCQNELLIEQRPNEGIWPNLYSLLEWETLDQLEHWLQENSIDIKQRSILPSIKHRFTHFELTLKPICYTTNITNESLLIDSRKILFVSQMKLTSLAKPKPIQSILTQWY